MQGESDSTNVTAVLMSGPTFLPGLQDTLNIFVHYIMLVIGILGVVNNALSALVFSVFYSKFPPSCLYFLVLSVSDFFAVWFLCIFQWAADGLRYFGLPSFDMFTQNLWGCRVMRYLQIICTSLGAYVMVVLSFERAACLLSPVRFISFFTVRRRIAMLICVVLVSAVLWTQTFVAFDIRPRFVNGSLSGCYPNVQLPAEFSLAFNYQMLFINYTIPAFLILIGNLIGFLGYRMNRMRQLQNDSRDRLSSTENDVKVTMVMLSLQYLILNLPYSVSWPLFSFLKFYRYEISNPDFFYNASYMNTIFMVIAYINLSINFYFYLLKVKCFKKYLMILTIGICCRCRNTSRRSIDAPSSSEGRPNRDRQRISSGQEDQM